MSRKSPGVLFDASNSWNGYNHQGKLALFFSIDQMADLIDPAASDEDNKLKLSRHFVEIEHLEDFSIGTIENGEQHYSSVHQVKDMEKEYVSAYASAIQGLAKHLIDDPEIGDAFLHVTKELKPGKKSFKEHLYEMIDSYDYPGGPIREINEKRGDADYREKLLTSKEKKYEGVQLELRHALDPVSDEPPALTKDNLDEAFDRRLAGLQALTANREKLKQTYEEKIKLFPYKFKGKPQLFCKEDQAAVLVRESIEKFYKKKFPGGYQSKTEHINNAYVYLIYRLDDYVVQRARYFYEYKRGDRERYIPYSELYDWLLNDEIGNPGKAFYIYHVREFYFRLINLACRHCRRKGKDAQGDEVKCGNACRILQFENVLRRLNEEQMETFLYTTFPNIHAQIDLSSCADYLQKEQFRDPFLKGLQKICMPFDENEEQSSIVYRDREQQQYVLTALAREYADDEEDDPEICRQIKDNPNVHELLMDYRFLISRDVEVESIRDACLSIDPDQSDTDDSDLKNEHILRIGKVGIIPLEEFISNLHKEDDDS